MPDLVTDGDNLGDHLATRSFKTIKGTDIASATNITIGTSGNTFDVTGTTTIQHFDNANWVVGSVISLHFDGAVTLTNNAGGLSGNQANILLSGDANFTTATGDILTFLLHDSTSWQEISRNSVASIANNSITNAKGKTGIDAVKLADGSVTNSELKYINTLSDNAQNQLNLKSPIANPTFTGTVVLPNVPAIVTTQLNLKAPTASPTFTGTITASALTASGQITSNGNIQMGTGAKITNIKNLQHEVSTSGVDIDFSENQLQTMSIASNTTFTTTNRAVGLSKTIRIITDGTTRTLTFPSDWKFIGTKPTDQAGSKTGILTVTNFGTTDAYIVAGYAVEE